MEPILRAAREGDVTLVYSSHDVEHNNAVVLKAYMKEKLMERKGHRKSAA